MKLVTTALLIAVMLLPRISAAQDKTAQDKTVQDYCPETLTHPCLIAIAEDVLAGVSPERAQAQLALRLGRALMAYDGPAGLAMIRAHL